MTAIQYSSQLFLSFKAFKHPEKLLKPSAPTLVLAGNCFRYSGPHNLHWLKYITESWNNTIIVPGFLEHSTMGVPTPSEGDQGQLDTRETYQCLLDEIKPFNNIKVLSSSSHIIDDMLFTGITKWPYEMPPPEVDLPSRFMHEKYKMQNKLWKYEGDEWLRDILNRYSYSVLYKHIIVSYYPPLTNWIPLANRHYITKDKKDAICYSLYSPLESNKIHAALWIYGTPKATLSGMCPYNNTFITSNSADSHAYIPSMITNLGPS
jgi:hypothetical protein